MAEKTTWEGLWKRRSGVYCSRRFNIEEFPKHTSIVVRYNKFYDKNTSRPRFVFCFADKEAEKDLCDEIVFEDYESTKEMLERTKDSIKNTLAMLEESMNAVSGVTLRDDGGYQWFVYDWLQETKRYLEHETDDFVDFIEDIY